MRTFFKAAIKNVYKHGDTDIFPFPIENRIFHDSIDDSVVLLDNAYKNFSETFAQVPPHDIRSPVPMHHLGFRWATQLDPFWNAFFLGCVLSVAKEIEHARVADDHVFSYRLDINTYLEGDIFRNDINWIDFIKRSDAISRGHDYVVVCDVADCYSRISHHKLDNALRMNNCPHEIRQMILGYLSYLTGTRSSGLPIGGPASRILSELALSNTDHILSDSGITYVRYADDYHIFCSDKKDAYDRLVLLSTTLDNEGLSLQRSKTRILTRAEFTQMNQTLFGGDEAPGSPIHRLMSLRLRYDPYSRLASANYEELRRQLEAIDIVGLLNEQLSRTRVHVAATKKIIAALSLIESDAVYSAITSMLSSMDVLYPIASNVFITIYSLFDKLKPNEKATICEILRNLYVTRHEVMSVPTHVSYAIRIMGKLNNAENQRFLHQCFDRESSPLIRRDIILIFANWGNFAWLSLFKAKFGAVSGWERRALVLASYAMADEGRHWRESVKARFDPVEVLVRDWRAARLTATRELPL